MTPGELERLGLVPSAIDWDAYQERMQEALEQQAREWPRAGGLRPSPEQLVHRAEARIAALEARVAALEARLPELAETSGAE